MQKLEAVEIARALMSEGKDWSVLRWLFEKRRVREAADSVFWGGYSGYFADPEGNLWEVAFNPFTDLT